LPALATAQMTVDSVYQGRLTTASGAPLAGPAALTLRIYDAASAGTALYSEEHPAVALDSNGLFSVRLGSGANAVGNYDPALFSTAPRFLEIEVNGAVLTPRQIVGAVPTALIAADVVNDPASNIGAAVANAQATADAAVLGHTIDTNTQLSEAEVDSFVSNNGFLTLDLLPPDANTQLSEAEVDAFVANNGYSSLGATQRIARGWNLTCASVSISIDGFAASDCTRKGLDFSCDDVLELSAASVSHGDPCDSAFVPSFAAFNTRDASTKTCSCANN